MAAPEDIEVLLVDDLPENLLALEALLRRDGLRPVQARSAAEALELMLVHDFALALLDVQMPETDGFELAELMRGVERTRAIPIIFLTAVATDERRRFRGYEAGAVDYLLKPLDQTLLLNKVEVFVELARQRRELARQRDALSQTAEQLSAALTLLRAHGDNSPLAIVRFDPSFRVTEWSQGAARLFGWSAAEAVGRMAVDLGWLEAGMLQPLASLSRANPRTVALLGARSRDGALLDCEFYASALLDGEGRLASVNAQILDVTERRRAEETQQLLIGELNHRVKNMLATVQAIASQTLRHAPSPADFSSSFTGRIQAMARAHSLLSDATWQGARLSDLIRAQLRLGAFDETRIAAGGPNLFLSPQLALHLGLILHELGTNAIKYGALSLPQGQVRISWIAEGESLRLSWVERGGPPAKPPARRGFGTTLIEQSVKAQGGVARASYGAEGVRWEIEVAMPPPGTPPGPPARAATAAQPGPAEPLIGTVEVEPGLLAGRRILVVEDEPLVALELTTILEEAGAAVLGPAATPEEVLDCLEQAEVDGALLDGNLRGRAVDDVAAMLAQRKVPFAFVSGYAKDNLPRAFAEVPLLGKPFTGEQLLRTTAGLFAASPVAESTVGEVPVAESTVA